MKRSILVFVAILLLSESAVYAFDPKGMSGRTSNGTCVCKTHCDQFAKAGQAAGPKLAQCKSDCEQKYSGCNKGAQR